MSSLAALSLPFRLLPPFPLAAAAEEEAGDGPNQPEENGSVAVNWEGGLRRQTDRPAGTSGLESRLTTDLGVRQTYMM
jgi:hypothetical protein